MCIRDSIDAAGLSILSQIRTYYPSAKSILMDRATFEKYYENGKSEKAISAKLLKGLTIEELNLFNYLNENKLRLEQEMCIRDRLFLCLKRIMHL